MKRKTLSAARIDVDWVIEYAAAALDYFDAYTKEAEEKFVARYLKAHPIERYGFMWRKSRPSTREDAIRDYNRNSADSMYTPKAVDIYWIKFAGKEDIYRCLELAKTTKAMGNSDMLLSVDDFEKIKKYGERGLTKA